MACPYFSPDQLLETLLWARPPRMPLGAVYQGSCHADPTQITTPSGKQVQEVCNAGYARGRCPRFPQDAPADAVRFSIQRQGDEYLELVWVKEAACVPVAHGPLRFVTKEDRLEGTQEPLLARQARAFLVATLLPDRPLAAAVEEES